MRSRISKLSMVLAVFITIFFICESKVDAAWYNASWKYRKKITIDYTKVSGGANLSYFPMLLTMGERDLKTIANGGYMGNSGGTDIVFTSSDEVTKIPHEIEKFTDSTGELKAWVRIPTLSCSANTVIYMYYGNAGCADQQDKTGTWNDGGSNYYKGVWHYPDGTSLTANDSTGNGNNGTVTGATATTGPIGGAANFTGTTNSIATPSTSALNTDIHTISFWFKLNSTSANWTQIIAYRPVGTDRSPGIWVYSGGQNIHWKYDPGNTGTNAIGPNGEGTNFNLGQWYYVVGVKNGGTFDFYVNGGVSGSGIVVANPKTSGNAAIEFGRTGYDSPSMSLDEARVASTVRSAGWIATEYNNQSSPLTFYSVGVTAGVTWTQAIGTPSWGPRGGYGCVVYNNKLWIIGGNASGRKKDVWSTDDPSNVAAWTQVTSAAAWVERDGLGCVAYDNKMWVIKGNCCRSDVWYSSDGTNWYQATADSGMGGGYLWDNLVVFDNKMWVIGKTNFVNSVYYSTNGVNWTAASTPPWTGTNGQHCLVYDNKMWILCGSLPGLAPYQNSLTGTLSTDQAYNYSMGYKFTPTKEARITGFYGFFNGTKTIKLYDSYYNVLASASLASLSTLTGSIDPTASTTVTGVGTQFLTQLAVDNFIVVSGEVRLVTAIASDTSLTVDTAFSDGPNDTSPDKQTTRWSWPLVNITPVNVEIGATYYVVVELAGSGGAYRNPATNIPLSYNYITINATVYQTPSGTFNASHTETTSPMYGLVDIQVDDRTRDDVWYSGDGSNWTQATSNAAYGARWSYSCVVFDNKMWVFGGNLTGDCRKGDAWYSTDGANWTRATSTASFAGTPVDRAVVFKNKTWLFTTCGGQKVWYSNSDYWNP